jgi:hypothetical protein
VRSGFLNFFTEGYARAKPKTTAVKMNKAGHDQHFNYDNNLKD